MMPAIREQILLHSHPMKPIATSVEPRLQQLAGIQAVVFDVYGTLLISGCGEIGTAESNESAFFQALDNAGIKLDSTRQFSGTQMIRDEILADHDRSRSRGIEYPEVDAVEIWRCVVDQLIETGAANRKDKSKPLDIQQMIASYELNTNPVWPMPNAQRCMEQLTANGKTLGIISNAQFLTIELWQTLLDETHADFQVEPGLQFYSYRFGHAKPGLKMFEFAADELRKRGIQSSEVLYVGNDMLNDMLPAATIGFRTALFAGDGRSLRIRECDSRTKNIRPDIVLTQLSDICDSVIMTTSWNG